MAIAHDVHGVTPGWARQDGRDWVVLLRVQPRAVRDDLVGVVDGRLRVRIAAAPHDGKANQHLQRWLARTLGLSRAQVVIEHGATGRDKRVRLIDVGPLPAPLAGLDEPSAS
jgi:uncharacterized protein